MPSMSLLTASLQTSMEAWPKRVAYWLTRFSRTVLPSPLISMCDLKVQETRVSHFKQSCCHLEAECNEDERSNFYALGDFSSHFVRFEMTTAKRVLILSNRSGFDKSMSFPCRWESMVGFLDNVLGLNPKLGLLPIMDPRLRGDDKSGFLSNPERLQNSLLTNFL